MPKGLTDNLQNLINDRSGAPADEKLAIKVAQPSKNTYQNIEVVKSGRKENEEDVQNYSLRLPKDFYKALRAYCDDRGTTMNTFIFGKLKESVENDPDFKKAFDYVNRK